MDKYLNSAYVPKTDRFTSSKFVTPFIPKFDYSKYAPTSYKTAPSVGPVQGPEKPATTTAQTKTTPAATTTTTAKPSTTKTTTVKAGKTAEQKYQEDIRRQINDAYNAQINFLTGQEQSLQRQLPDFLTSVARPFEAQQPLLEQQLAEQQAKGAAEQEGLRMQEQQGLAQVRRTAEESGLRSVQQFGGVAGSSAAQAAGELIAREQLRQTGAVQQQKVQGIQNINDQLRAIQGEYNAQVSNLALRKEQALSSARLEFQKQLDAIKMEKMTAGVTKAQRTIDALGQFAQTRQLIERDAQTLQNNLTLIREQALLAAQNARLTQTLTGQTATPLPFKVSNFFTESTPNQSNELAKVLQAGLAAGTLKSIGKTSEGIDLFTDVDGSIVDIRGNKYQ